MRRGARDGDSSVGPDWEAVKFAEMYDVVRLWAAQNVPLGEQLRGTRPHDIVEGNTWHDNTWGACTCHGCREVPKLNWLGIILTRVRDL